MAVKQPLSRIIHLIHRNLAWKQLASTLDAEAGKLHRHESHWEKRVHSTRSSSHWRQVRERGRLGPCFRQSSLRVDSVFHCSGSDSISPRASRQLRGQPAFLTNNSTNITSTVDSIQSRRDRSTIPADRRWPSRCRRRRNLRSVRLFCPFLCNKRIIKHLQ